MRRCAALPQPAFTAAVLPPLPLLKAILLLFCVARLGSMHAVASTSQGPCSGCPCLQIDDEDEEAPKKRKRADSDEGAPAAAYAARISSPALPPCALRLCCRQPALCTPCNIVVLSSLLFMHCCCAADYEDEDEEEEEEDDE